MEIITLLKANIRNKKGSFVSVLILTFIVALCLTTIISINYNFEKRTVQALEEAKVSDLTAIIWDVQFPDSMLQKVEANENIDHISVIKTIKENIKIKEKTGDATFFKAYNQMDQPYKIYKEDGLSFQEEPEELQPGEIYVPISFQQIYACKVGDMAYFQADNSRSFRIKGFFEEPFIGAELIGIKLALMNEEDFNSLYGMRCLNEIEREEMKNGIVGYYFVNLYQAKGSTLTPSKLKRSVNEASGLIDFSLLSLSKEQSKSWTLMLIQVISGILMVFIILLYLVVLIIMGHSINTGIEMDYSNLGILKAIGYPKNKLRKVYVLEYVLAELIGIAFGMIGSLPAIYYLNGLVVRLAGLLSSAGIDFGHCLFVLAAIVLISAIFIFIKTKTISKISPIRAITGLKDHIYFHSRLELPVEGRGVYFKIAIRQLTSNMKQYISTTFIVAILVFFLISITLLNTAMDSKSIGESFGEIYSDIEVFYGQGEEEAQEEIELLQKKVEEDISDISPIITAFQIESSYFSVNGEEYHCNIYGNPTMIKSMLKGRAPIYDNEIIITGIVADEMGLQMGDTVIVGNKDKEEEYIISGIFQSTFDLGRTIAISFEGARRIIPDYEMQSRDYLISDSNKSTEITKALKEKYKDQIKVADMNEEGDTDNTEVAVLKILNMLIYIISIIFAFVVVMLLCGKVFLKERMDYGIYKSLGFTSRTLRFQFALRFAIVAFLGGILGACANICLNNVMMSTLLRSIGITNFTTEYNLASILIPIVVLIVCFFLFAYLVSSRIKRVDTKSLISDN